MRSKERAAVYHTGLAVYAKCTYTTEVTSLSFSGDTGIAEISVEMLYTL